MLNAMLPVSQISYPQLYALAQDQQMKFGLSTENVTNIETSTQWFTQD